MKRTPGFSKYALAFSDNTDGPINTIEGPEELVQFLVKNKEGKTNKRNDNVTTTKNKPVEHKKIEVRQNYPSRKNQEHRSTTTNTKSKYADNEPVTESTTNTTTIELSNHDMTYDHSKNSRPVRSRGGPRDNRQRNNFDNGANPSHRQFDRHSGMVKSNVKPTSKVHGRDDNNWRDEINGGVSIDNDGAIHIDDVTSSTFGTVDKTSIKETKIGTTNNNKHGGDVRQSRGGVRQSRGGFRGRNRPNDNRRNPDTAGEPNSNPRRGGGRGRPSNRDTNHNNNNTKNDSGITSNEQASTNFIFDDNDFPSFDI